MLEILAPFLGAQILIALRDQIRENVLVKQYYCDVDIAHLISYNEELAHKLTTQPADIIPLVLSSILSVVRHTDGCLVRISAETMHKSYRVPVPKSRRPPPPSAPITTTLHCLSNLNPRSRLHQHFPPRPHSWYCDRRINAIVKGNSSIYTMS